jgi:hypothetical protein
MRSACIVVWALLLLLVAIPAARHASAPDAAGSTQASVKPAPRSAPPIARTAATIAALGIAVPAWLIVAVASPAVEPRVPTGRTVDPLVPLRL